MKSLMYIEPSETMAAVVSEVLSSMQVDLRPTPNICHAMEKIRREGAPDAVLLSRKTDPAICPHRLAELRTLMGYRPVLVSSESRDEFPEAAILSGQTRWLSYPFSGHELVESVSHALNLGEASLV